MTFRTEVIGCYWQQEKGEWLVKLKQTQANGSTREFEDTGHIVLLGSGILNNFKWPEIKGLEKFKGRVYLDTNPESFNLILTLNQVIHTAQWDTNYQQEDWKKDRIAVIGSGASSIQTVPSMQPFAKHLDVFVRTGEKVNIECARGLLSPHSFPY